jgi:hypothetical protein
MKHRLIAILVLLLMFASVAHAAYEASRGVSVESQTLSPNKSYYLTDDKVTIRLDLKNFEGETFTISASTELLSGKWDMLIDGARMGEGYGQTFTKTISKDDSSITLNLSYALMPPRIVGQQNVLFIDVLETTSNETFQIAKITKTVSSTTITPTPTVVTSTPTPAPTCAIGWKCKNSDTAAYQESDCSWSTARAEKPCEYGQKCENGECVNVVSTITPTPVPTTSTPVATKPALTTPAATTAAAVETTTAAATQAPAEQGDSSLLILAVIAVVAIAAVVAFVVLEFLRKPGEKKIMKSEKKAEEEGEPLDKLRERKKQLEDRLAKLEGDMKAGGISAREYTELKDGINKRILEVSDEIAKKEAEAAKTEPAAEEKKE